MADNFIVGVSFSKMDSDTELNFMTEIKLPFNKTISESSPMFIIAEVGSNWDTKEDCMASIRAARAYGADAVKFQLYDEYSFYAIPEKRSHQLPVEWLKELKEECDNNQIEFMCSCFSEKLLKEADQYLNIHKIASAEMCHLDLLCYLKDTVNGHFKKPVLLSTGSQGSPEIGESLAILRNPYNPEEHAPEVVLMYCVSAYPARHTQLEKITMLEDEFGTLVGFSDHSMEVYTNPVLSYKYGARVLEKHVNFVGAVSPDSPHSISGEEFQRMCMAIRGQIKPRLHYDVEEQEMVTQHNRRLIATKDIRVGEILKYSHNFGIYRSTKFDSHGFSPFMRDHVDNKEAKKEIKAGDSIGPGDY